MINRLNSNQTLVPASQLYKGKDSKGRPTHWIGIDAECFEDHACEIYWDFLAEVALDFPSGEDMYTYLIHIAAMARGDQTLSEEQRVTDCSFMACHALVAINKFFKETP